MLGDEVDFAYEAVFDKEGFGETDAGVEVEVGERHGVFEDVPECFLRVEEEEVGAEGERGFGETLCERNLKLDVGVLARDGLADGTAENEIVVLVETEEGPGVECAAHGVGVDHDVFTFGHVGEHLGAEAERGEEEGERENDESEHGGVESEVRADEGVRWSGEMLNVQSYEIFAKGAEFFPILLKPIALS